LLNEKGFRLKEYSPEKAALNTLRHEHPPGSVDRRWSNRGALESFQ